jgi:predicted DNA-binding WGR domain protein
MAEHIYTQQDGSHNKFWSWERVGNNVVFKWGRIGRTPQSNKKPWSQSLVDKKVAAKLRKNYVLADEEKLEKEKKTADLLGTQNTISSLKWVNKVGKKLSGIPEYDPDKWVFVEIMNSWSKTKTHFLLSSSDSDELHGVKIRGNTISYTSAAKSHSRFVTGVREYLKGIAQKVRKVIQDVFAQLGTRKLDGLMDDDEDTMETAKKEIKKLMTDVDDGVIDTFAALGTREIDL